MKQIKIHLKSDSDAYNASARVLDAPVDGSVDVIIKNHESDRSLKQNRLAFKWYAAISQQTGQTKEEVRNYWKLHGLRHILLVDDETGSVKKILDIIDRLPYPDQIDAMELIEVTRLFNVHQFTEYLRMIEAWCGSNGIGLPMPDDEYNEAMGRYRL